MPALARSARTVHAVRKQQEVGSFEASTVSKPPGSKAGVRFATRDGSGSFSSSEQLTWAEVTLKIDSLLNGQDRLAHSMDAIASKLGVTQTVAPKRDPGMSDSQSSLYQATPATPPLVTREAAVEQAIDMEVAMLAVTPGEQHLDLDEAQCTQFTTPSEALPAMVADSSIDTSRRTVAIDASPATPTSFHPREEWRHHAGQQLHGITIVSHRGQSQSNSGEGFLMLGGSLILNHMRKWPCSCSPLSPEGPFRMVMDMLSMVLLVVDSVLVPYQLAWEVNGDDLVSAYALMIVSFWTLDMILGFCTGYYTRDHVLVKLYGPIARRYLRTSFPLDFVVVACDWTDVAFEMLRMSGNNLAIVKVLRLLKLGRLIRLGASIRGGKLARMYTKAYRVAQKNGYAEWLAFSTHIVKIMFLIAWINHIGGCIWHIVGISSARNWHRASNLVSDSVEYSLHEYTLYFYWSVTAMVSGASFMVPTTQMENLYITCFILFSLIFGSTLISSLAAMLMELEVSSRERAYAIQTLRAYLYQNHIKASLAVRIEDEIRDGLASEKRFSEADVPSLSLLSSKIRAELWVNVYGPQLLASRIFMRAVSSEGMTFLRDLCQHALSRDFLSAGVEIFNPDMDASGAYFVHYGSMEYQYHDALEKTMSDGRAETPNARGLRKGQAETKLLPSPSDDTATKSKRSYITSSWANGGGRNHKVGVGEWVCEVALWSYWVHCGWMEVATPCELLSITAESLIKVVHGHPEAASVCGRYSVAYCKIANRALESDASCLSDLCHFVHEEDLLPLLPTKTRVAMSTHGFNLLNSQLGWTQFLTSVKMVEDLAAQVNDALCDLWLISQQDSPKIPFASWKLGTVRGSSAHTVVRIISIVVLELRMHPSGRTLVHLGFFHKHRWTEQLGLPSCVIEAGETQEDAIDRLLGWFPDLLPHIQIDTTLAMVEERNGRSLNLLTRIRKTVVKARIIEDELPDVMHLPAGTTVDPDDRIDRLKSATVKPAHELAIAEVLVASTVQHMATDSWLRRHTQMSQATNADLTNQNIRRVLPFMEAWETQSFAFVNTDNDGRSISRAYTWMRMADFDSIRGTIDGRVAVSVFLEERGIPDYHSDKSSESSMSFSPAIEDSEALGV
mmetsp:Transcript_43579/g.100413  ORF Transcript_43579/g.100413 Transcript_43579/m.100413 type:complete len:1128 (+) Transcript_43579:92-3475(+)